MLHLVSDAFRSVGSVGWPIVERKDAGRFLEFKRLSEFYVVYTFVMRNFGVENFRHIVLRNLSVALHRLVVLWMFTAIFLTRASPILWKVVTLLPITPCFPPTFTLLVDCNVD